MKIYGTSTSLHQFCLCLVQKIPTNVIQIITFICFRWTRARKDRFFAFFCQSSRNLVAHSTSLDFWDFFHRKRNILVLHFFNIPWYLLQKTGFPLTDNSSFCIVAKLGLKSIKSESSGWLVFIFFDWTRASKGMFLYVFCRLEIYWRIVRHWTF